MVEYSVILVGMALTNIIISNHGKENLQNARHICCTYNRIKNHFKNA